MGFVWNWDASAIGTWLGVCITGLLTYIIINQTSRINKEQINLERRINEQQIALQERVNKQQMDIQKRQIKIDLFPHKRELYLNLYRVLEFSKVLEEDIFNLNLEERKGGDLFKIYEIVRDQYLGDYQLISRSLREADYILPRTISPSVLVIRNSYEDICARFISLNAVSTFFENELSEQKMKETVKLNLNGIKESCKTINSHTPFILSIMPEELNISVLDR